MRMERKNSLRDSAVGSPDCNLKNIIIIIIRTLFIEGDT